MLVDATWFNEKPPMGGFFVGARPVVIG